MFQDLESSRTGLSSEEAKKRLERDGPNSLPEKKENPFLKFFRFFLGPIPGAMEFAALLALIMIDYVDTLLILALLFLNAGISFWEEKSSGDLIKALKGQLSAQCRVRFSPFF